MRKTQKNIILLEWDKDNKSPKPKDTPICNLKHLTFYLAKDTKQKAERNKLVEKEFAICEKGLLFIMCKNP